MTPRISIPLGLLLVMTAGSLAFFIYFGQWFPPTLAVHFTLSGVPDGWTDRITFIVIGSSVSLMLPAFVVTCMGVMPRVLPPGMLNLPNRDYWLAPERRETTLSRLLVFALWLGCIVEAWLIAINAVIARANPQGAPAHLSPVHAVAVAGFIVLILLWGWRLARAFSRRT